MASPAIGQALCRGLLQPVEEKGYADIERPAEFEQTAGADAVGALLIFLNLLKSNADPIRQLLLGNAPDLADKPQSFANMQIHRMWQI